MSLKNLYITGDAPGLPRPEPAEVYQEATLSLRYKSITAITAVKLQRAMALLQLEPHVLVQRGLASRSSLERSLEYGEGQGKQFSSVVAKRSNSPRVVSSCLQEDLNEIDDEHDENGQDDGWGDYEDNYDSDSDIDDDEDQDDEIEVQRKGPIYAFLVYGGVQLRPDEYVLLFRALGVSPQYIEQFQYSNGETNQKPYKAPPPSPHAYNPAHVAPPSRGSDNLERYSSSENIDHRSILCEGARWHECICRHVCTLHSLQTSRDMPQQTFQALNSVLAT